MTKARAGADEKGWCFDEARERDKASVGAWREPKTRHKRFVSRLLQCRAHLVLCMRAEEKIRIEKVKDERGRERTVIVQSKDLPPNKDLPFAFASPEWSNEKGVGAALSFRLLGLDSYHCIGAPVHGSANVQRFLEEGTRDLLGGGMVVETDPAALGARIVEDLNRRRAGLGWQV